MQVPGYGVIFWKLILKYEELVLPLSERMRLCPKGSFILNESEKQTINTVIKELNKLSALSHPQSTNYLLISDSSNYAVGAALHHVVNGNVGYFSKKLTQTQTMYSLFWPWFFSGILGSATFLSPHRSLPGVASDWY